MARIRINNIQKLLTNHGSDFENIVNKGLLTIHLRAYKKNITFAAQLNGPIVQGIERKFPKLQIQVRVLVGLQNETLN